MRQALTISIPEPIKKEVDGFVAATGITRSELFRKAVDDYMYFAKLKQMRNKMMLMAAKHNRGKFYTDEDIFKLVS